MEEILEMDSSLFELEILQPGMKATRNSVEDKWTPFVAKEEE